MAKATKKAISRTMDVKSFMPLRVSDFRGQSNVICGAFPFEDAEKSEYRNDEGQEGEENDYLEHRY